MIDVIFMSCPGCKDPHNTPIREIGADHPLVERALKELEGIEREGSYRFPHRFGARCSTGCVGSVLPVSPSARPALEGADNPFSRLRLASDATSAWRKKLRAHLEGERG